MLNRWHMATLACAALTVSACQGNWEIPKGYVLECGSDADCPSDGECIERSCQIDDDPICGNGVIETGEACDEGDGNADGYHPTKTCLSDCSDYGGYCGDDDTQNGSEQCDDGSDNSDINPNACRTNCMSPRCGDLVVDTVLGEICDDGEDDNTDAYGEPGRCGADCIAVAPHCGDAIQNGAEQCDDGSDNSDINPDACRTHCMSPSCGDAVVDTGLGEACDDGNTQSGDYCAPDCSAPTSVCGDGVVELGEACDDGSSNTDDHTSAPTCNATCTDFAPHCGDGTVAVEESCDDGESNTNTYQLNTVCNASCSGFAPRCGDGNVTHDEQCDDETENTDAYSEIEVCNSSCSGRAPRCGDGRVDSEFDEVCDEGEGVNTDDHALLPVCNSTCSGLAPYCGDNIENGTEVCDDGNTTNDGNGCSSDCQRLGYCGDDEVQYYFEGCDDGESATDDDDDDVINTDTCAYGSESCVVCVPPGYDDPSNDQYDTPDGCQYRSVLGGSCGDGVIQREAVWGGTDSSPWEGCDGNVDCSELGLGTGLAVCDGDCVAYDTSDCSDRTMVYVPAGPFTMGCNATVDFACASDELPSHEVWLDEFWIDRTEVTAGEYKECMDADECSYSASHVSDRTYDNGMDDHAINLVMWSQATAYCAWREKRLPTEAEWEKAARGVGGSVYPWGNDEPACELAWYDPCPGNTVEPVGSLELGMSPYGALDMAGNVYEWVSDYYFADYYQVSPAGGWVNPQGPENELYRVVRGGSYNWWVSSLRASERSSQNLTAYSRHIGFRCVKPQ